MGYRAIAWAWTIPTLSPPERLTLLALADSADNRTGECWPGLDRVADMTGLTRRATTEIVKRLGAMGHIDITARTDDSGRQQTNLYRLNIGDERRSPRPDRDDVDTRNVVHPSFGVPSEPLREPVKENQSELAASAGVRDTPAPADMPLAMTWSLVLMALPAWQRRGITASEVMAIEAEFAGLDLAAESRTYVAWWAEGSKRLQRPMAGWRSWLVRAKRDAVGRNGTAARRYRAPVGIAYENQPEPFGDFGTGTGSPGGPGAGVPRTEG